MSDFIRQPSIKWHQEVPGARWFRADLHIHTLDDEAGRNVTRPPGLAGDASDPNVQTRYARAFLKAAVANQIEIIGLTPHAVRTGESDDTCCLWRILDAWNQDVDDDGVPFREKIYAIFPGFEPNFDNGAEGLHLIFLFDPEITRSTFLNAFAEIMGALPPWDNGSLRLSTKKADQAFESIQELHKRIGGRWDYVCIAPHAFSTRGLFQLKAQVLANFPHEHIAALELKDNSLPEDVLAEKPWLKDGIAKYHHALFHSSDAYSLEDIGRRYTFIKLASPRIAALRQAFLAHDSRLRMAFVRDSGGALNPRADPPDPHAARRPWLRAVTIRAGASFFAGRDGVTHAERAQTFLLNPDLTCVIGGRMSGKSTLLDGLRVWGNFSLPEEIDVRTDVEKRANSRFLAGSPFIECGICGPANPTLPVPERWPARFFTQRELQRAVRDPEERRQLLYQLIPGEGAALRARSEQIAELDRRLSELAAELVTTRANMVEAEQSFDLVKKSKEALETFKSAGGDRLIAAQADHGRVQSCYAKLEPVGGTIESALELLDNLAVPETIDSTLLKPLVGDENEPGMQSLGDQIRKHLEDAGRSFLTLTTLVERVQQLASSAADRVRSEVELAIISAGGTPEQINQFEAISQSAAQFEVCQGVLTEARRLFVTKLIMVGAKRHRRTKLINQQREAIVRVSAKVAERFPDRIRIRELRNAASDKLEGWILGLREQGITRWWNNRKSSNDRPSPDDIVAAIGNRQLKQLDMSDQVAHTFEGVISPEQVYALLAVRSDDEYEIESKVGDQTSDFMELSRLSGGAQVSVLLSLVLETDDSTPLVIDQPEDELDKAYLFETFLPALRRLKGKRQVIFATHDANIVVNGDADQVIYLEAGNEYGRIVEQGAIEGDRIRDAIVNILDGGKDAFTLRRAKYGF